MTPRRGDAGAHFPGFTPEVEIPPGFEDFTQGGDPAPNYRHMALNLVLWIAPAAAEGPRYRLGHLDGWGAPLAGVPDIAGSDAFEDILAALIPQTLSRHGWDRLPTGGGHEAWRRSLPQGKRAYITGPRGTDEITPGDRVLAVIQWPDGRDLHAHLESVEAAIAWVADHMDSAPAGA